MQFGNVVHPPFIDRLIPDKQNRAWDDLGSRRPVGVCQHSMVGSLWSTDGWFRRGVRSTGLTDYGVGGATDGAAWDGAILRWNDPLGRATSVAMRSGVYVEPETRGASRLAVSANRAGWANGGSDGLEGDGPAFVRALGVSAINRDLVSIERSDGSLTTTPMSARQLTAICALTAYWFDQARVPWDRFPEHPEHGCVTHLLHFEFATKSCPHAPVTSRIEEIQARVRQTLKAGQTGSREGIPVPAPPSPGKPGWPSGYVGSALAERFGVLTRRNGDGSETPFRFDPTGVISNAWVARGVSEGRSVTKLPKALTWWSLRADDDQAYDLVAFDDSWLLFRAARHIAWRWIA